MVVALTVPYVSMYDAIMPATVYAAGLDPDLVS